MNTNSHCTERIPTVFDVYNQLLIYNNFHNLPFALKYSLYIFRHVGRSDEGLRTIIEPLSHNTWCPGQYPK